MTTAQKHREWMKERYGEYWEPKNERPVPKSGRWDRFTDWACESKVVLWLLVIVGGIFLVPYLIITAYIWPLWVGWQVATKYGEPSPGQGFGIKDIFKS